MAYCRNCGKQISENDKFCASCGTPTQDGFERAKKTVQDKFNEMNDTTDHTYEYAPADIDSNKIVSIFAYLNLLILIPVFVAKDSQFAKFHVSQGVNLLVAHFAYWVLAELVMLVFAWVPIVAEIVGLFMGVLNLGICVLTIIGICNVLNGKAKELPIIGSWKIVNY